MSIAQAHERAIAHLRHDLSPEEQQARSGNPRRSCPRCGRAFRWRRPRYRRADGRPVAWVNRIGAHRVPSWLLHQASATVAECSRCGGHWLVFAESVEPQRGSVRFDEQERYWEDGATQTRTIDNSRRNSELKQSEGFAHEWRASVTVGREVGTSVELSALGANAERAVKAHYDLSHENVRTDTTEVQVTVPPRTISTITLRPEYEWRRGVVHVQDGRRWVDLPYHARVAVNLRVDVDETGA